MELSRQAAFERFWQTEPEWRLRDLYSETNMFQETTDSLGYWLNQTLPDFHLNEGKGRTVVSILNASNELCNRHRGLTAELYNHYQN